MHGSSPILLTWLLVACLIAPALRGSCACCGDAQEPEVAVQAAGCGGGCCAAIVDPEPRGEGTDDTGRPGGDEGPAGGCDRSLCGCCSALPVLHRARPLVAMIAPVVDRIDERSPALDLDGVLQGLLRPPRS